MKAIIFLLVFAASAFASGECEFAKYVINSDEVPKWIQVNCIEDDGTYVQITFDRQLTHIFKRVRPSDAVGLTETFTAYSHYDKTGKTVFMDEVEYDDLGVKKRSLQKVLDISLRDVYDSIRNEFQFPVMQR